MDYFYNTLGLYPNSFFTFTGETNETSMDKKKQPNQPKEQTYFEKQWPTILKLARKTKAQFCREMGVLPQNFSKLCRTKNALTLTKMSDVIGIPVRALIDGETDAVTDSDLTFGCIVVNNRIFHFNDIKQFDYILRALGYTKNNNL